MYIDPHAIPQKDRYKITTGCILPRPIAWVSSRSEDGGLNLAPYSFFTVASTNPLVLMFCPQTPAPGQTKDTARNIFATQEFVINIVDKQTAEGMNLSATSLPPGESEFAFAQLAHAPSRTVGVPRVAAAPVAFECRLFNSVSINIEEKGGGHVIFGAVSHIYLRDDVYDAASGYVLLDKLQPIGRLSGNLYAHITDLFELIRQ